MGEKMSILRLRQVLGSNFTAVVDSSQATVDRVQQRTNAHRQSQIARGKTPPTAKQPQLVASLANTPLMTFRAIDVLRKTGELTTPQWANMARLSSSWATRRYFWAIAAARTSPGRFRINPECRDLDFHQKTLMSDEFGVGFAGLAIERLFNTNAWVDVSVALADRARYQNIRRQGRLQPDYLMWQDTPNAPYYVVECKGSQTQRSVSIDQIRRGLEQVPALRFGRQGRQVQRFVVATLLQATNTTVFVIDPEDDETPEEREKRIIAEHSKATSEKLSENVYLIPDPERFEEKTADARSAQLLNWAGQYRSAAAVEERIEIAPRARIILEDQPIATREVGDLRFDGFRVPLFPELGVPTLNLFVGVEHDILETAKRDQANARAAVGDRRARLVGLQEAHDTGRVSIGPSGTLLAIEGLD
jgi:hypothetical protein